MDAPIVKWSSQVHLVASSNQDQIQHPGHMEPSYMESELYCQKHEYSMFHHITYRNNAYNHNWDIWEDIN